MSDDLENLVYRLVERWMAARYTERHGLVTSYDPKNHLAKVAFQPEGQESGWLPIETGHIGAGYGIAIGLQPGGGGQGQSGQSGVTNQTSGDQVIVRYQEGDFESGKIVQRVHSQVDTPPQAQSGEIIMWTKFKQDSNAGSDAGSGGQSSSQGQQIYFKNDGSLMWTDGNGASIKCDGQGNVTINAKTVTITATTINTIGNTHLGSTGGVPAAMQGTVDTGGYSDTSNLATKVFVS
jgi:phage baseplate assembly protein gpV